MKKQLLKLTIASAVVLLSALAITSCGTYTTNVTAYDYSHNNPAWAPPYYPGARYYYFPDIECYYDLATRDFIVLNMGQWMFVPSIAPFYTTYDLYSSYIIVINTRVYQPWMHHHYYIRSYPRYYYIDYYDYSNIPYVRGFNENQKGAIFWGEKDRGKSRPWDDRNIRNNRKFNYSSADRRVQQETTRRVNQERAATADRTRAAASTTRSSIRTASDRTRQTQTVTPARDASTTRSSAGTASDRTRQTQAATPTRDTSAAQSTTPTDRRTQQQQTTTTRSSNTNYYGNKIGNPVRVEPQMRRTENTSTRSTRSDNNAPATRSSSGTRR